MAARKGNLQGRGYELYLKIRVEKEKAENDLKQLANAHKSMIERLGRDQKTYLDSVKVEDARQQKMLKEKLTAEKEQIKKSKEDQKKFLASSTVENKRQVDIRKKLEEKGAGWVKETNDREAMFSKAKLARQIKATDNFVDSNAEEMKGLKAHYKEMEKKQVQDKKFKMHLLSLMFFGMAVQRVFRQYTARTMEMIGVSDMFADALSLMVFKAWEPLLDTMYDVVGGLYDLPEPVQGVIGAFLTLGDVAGTALSTFGQWGLGMQGLQTQWPKMMESLSGFVGKLKEFGGKVFKATVSLAKGAWDATIGPLIQWYGKGGTKSMILKIGVTLAGIETGRRLFKQMMEWLGTDADAFEENHPIISALMMAPLLPAELASRATTGKGLWGQARAGLKSLYDSGGTFGDILAGIGEGGRGFFGLANGGIVNKPTLAMVGEAGPEAVVPLSGANAGGGMMGNITISPTVNINGGGSGMDAHQLADQISSIWSDDLRRMMLG